MDRHIAQAGRRGGGQWTRFARGFRAVISVIVVIVATVATVAMGAYGTPARAMDTAVGVGAGPVGTVRERLRFSSAALGGRPESYTIYLPAGYADPANAAARYPVLYLLHGSPGQPSDWAHGIHIQLMQDRGVAAGTLTPLIMVMPEGNGGVWRDSQYVNTHGGFRAEDLIVHDVVQYIDAHYRTIASSAARAIAGLSEGGYGAMNLGLKHPDIFGTIVSVSGYFAAASTEVTRGNDPWGRDWALMAANSPTLYAGRFGARSATHILIMDNTVDHPYTTDAVRFDRILTRARIAHTFLLQSLPGLTRGHSRAYWRRAFPTALAYVTAHLAPPSVVPSVAPSLALDYDSGTRPRT